MSNCIDCSEEELYLNNEPILDGEQSEQEIHLEDEPICDGVLSDQEIQLEIEPILPVAILNTSTSSSFLVSTRTSAAGLYFSIFWIVANLSLDVRTTAFPAILIFFVSVAIFIPPF